MFVRRRNTTQLPAESGRWYKVRCDASSVGSASWLARDQVKPQQQADVASIATAVTSVPVPQSCD